MAEQRLIDANTLLKTLDSVWDCNDMVFEPNDCICDPLDDCKGCKWRETLDFAKRIVKSSKAVDAVPVVRCKDCSVPHNYSTGCPKLGGLIPPEDFYCACGKRKDNEHDTTC